jgi:hypothetical protein
MKIHKSSEIQHNTSVGVCAMHVPLWSENLKERENVVDPGVDGRVI